jgi:hypothetical protein
MSRTTFGRKWSWPNRGSIPVFPSNDWGKSWRLCPHCQCPGRGSKEIHSRYNSTATPTHPATALRIRAHWVSHKCLICPDSSVGTATSYGLDGRGSIPGKGKIFLFFTAPRPALGPTQPHIQWVPRAISPGKEREADHSPPSSAEVKNDGAIPPLPHTPSWRGA